MFSTPRYFGCLSANEVGDFLAGVFAPMAFLWLVIAVIIQSQELAAQRRELRLMRCEYKENRKVATAQAEEARKQAEYIGKQTEILQQQQQRRAMEMADGELATRVTALAEWARTNLSNAVLVFQTDGGRIGYDPPASRLSIDGGPRAHLMNLGRSLAEIAASIEVARQSDRLGKIAGLSPVTAQQVLARFLEIVEYGDRVTAEWRSVLIEAELEDVIHTFANWPVKESS